MVPITNVSRALFGDSDQESLTAELENERKQLNTEKLRKWNFNFATELPTDGKYNWVREGEDFGVKVTANEIKNKSLTIPDTSDKCSRKLVMRARDCDRELKRGKTITAYFTNRKPRNRTTNFTYNMDDSGSRIAGGA